MQITIHVQITKFVHPIQVLSPGATSVFLASQVVIESPHEPDEIVEVLFFSLVSEEASKVRVTLFSRNKDFPLTLVSDGNSPRTSARLSLRALVKVS